DILLERVDRGKAGRLWLFSGRTLESVPKLYAGMNVESSGSVPSGFLTRTRIGGIPLVRWITLFMGLPLSYLAMVLLNRLLSRMAGHWRRTWRRNPDLHNPTVLPGPLRLLLLAGTIRWALAKAALPLMARQVWSAIAGVLVIVACVWILFLFSGWA